MKRFGLGKDSALMKGNELELKKNRLESEKINENILISYLNYITHLSRYAFASLSCGEKHVLDLGCGTGYGPYFLFKKNANLVVGIDISKPAIKIAKKEYNNNRIFFLIADAANLPFKEGAFDVVTSMGMLDHLPDFDSSIKECNRVLKLRGQFICSVLNRVLITPIPVLRTLDPFHMSEFSYDELASLLRLNFADVQGYGLTYGGKNWWQLRSLLDFLLRKVCIPESTRRGLSKKFFPHLYHSILYSTEIASKDPVLYNCLIKVRSKKEKNSVACILFSCKKRRAAGSR